MTHTLKDSIGFTAPGRLAVSSTDEEMRLREFVNLKLASRGYHIVGDAQDFPFLDLVRSLLAKFQEQSRLLAEYLCPADEMIDRYLRDYLGEDVAEASPNGSFLVPANALVLERHGIARMLSLPPDSDEFHSSILSSYRVHQGVCHNPAADRRTTQGVFHVAEEGLPIPFDKKAVPRRTFARLLYHAMNPPAEYMVLPFTGTSSEPAHVFVSLLLRPLISPEVPGVREAKSMEIRFFAPGSLVSNLDFVESIFGNAGDPYLPENDARLDVDHWSGHTGCVILAPQLTKLTKKELGLPHLSQASDRQRRDGMCWGTDDELYNEGTAFKVTCRDHRGVIVTIIADNYYGYCKKEVKTQISYACNLFGDCEEEHAGGAIAFPSFDLGEDFSLSEFDRAVDHKFAEVIERYSDLMEIRPEGYGIDRKYQDIIYVPEDVRIDLDSQTISWTNATGEQRLELQPHRTYVLPSGYKVEMMKPTAAQRWRLIGTNAEGTFCHKPCTVSGGGKSEISKSLADAMIVGPVIVDNLKADLDAAWEIINRDFSGRYKTPRRPGQKSRALLSRERSLGSVIHLLTPNPSYTDDYNGWLATIPRRIRDLVFVIKRFYKSNWDANWRERFKVDLIDGQPGNTLIYHRNRIISQYLRVGFAADNTWRTFSLRKDFLPARKIQMEDDISVSIVIPATQVPHLYPKLENPSLKFVRNCEYRLFQRPDDAIHRGYDRKTEEDFGQRGVFFSNYEPLGRDTAKAMLRDTIRFEQFTTPMQRVLKEFLRQEGPDFVISSNQPRLVDGDKPTKNPRYLQNRLDLEDPRAVYLAELGARLYRRVPLGRAVPMPVDSVLPGRRNNPPDHRKGIPALAVYGPIHYQQLPELFMDYIASLTGKSPSTTGAGSEGALTKGPFNALLPVHDLNAALVSYILTGYEGFTTAAGYIGGNYQVAHDISLLIPEVWSRMFIRERSPDYLMENGYLEAVGDMQHNGQTILSSRLGYRITAGFVATFFGRVFSAADTVFSEDMLRPELQSMDDFAEGVNSIVATQKRVAENYLRDGSIDYACPPLRALLYIMAEGSWEGKQLHHEEFRQLFRRESLLASDWYRQRLQAKQQVDRRLWARHEQYLLSFAQKPIYQTEVKRLQIPEKMKRVRQQLALLETETEPVVGTLGVDPSLLAPFHARPNPAAVVMASQKP